MPNVVFEDSNRGTSGSSSSGGAIMNFFIKRGIVKSASGANALMIVIVIIFLAVAGYVFYSTFYPSAPTPNATNTSPLQQKIQMYIKQGMTPIEARRKAMSDIRNANAVNTTTTNTK